MAGSVFQCLECTAYFQTYSGLYRHKQQEHNGGLSTAKYSLICSDCDETFQTHLNFVNHFCSIHDTTAKIEVFFFENDALFNEWRCNSETFGQFKFIRRDFKKYKEKSIEYLRCFRSGNFKSTSTGKSTKVQKIKHILCILFLIKPHLLIPF